MDDDQSTADATVVADETPASDEVLDVLSDTEDESTEVEAAPAKPTEEEAVEETPDKETEDEAETPPEGEQSQEETEETPDPKEEARRRYEERQAAIAEREERIQKESDEYIKQGEDEYDQRLRAMEVQEYQRTVENNENKLINEFERVKANPDLQIFNPDNKETFNERAYDKAMRDYNAGYIEYDKNSNMVGIKGSLFEHLTETAELLQGAVKSGAVQQVRATKTMRSNADPKPAAPPKAAVKDDILDILKSD